MTATATTPSSTPADPKAGAEPSKPMYTHGGDAWSRGDDAKTTPMKKYVFIQDDPFFLTKVLDKYLREFADTTVGINVQPNTQGKHTVVQTAHWICSRCTASGTSSGSCTTSCGRR